MGRNSDFSKCKVYKLVHADPSADIKDVYVGSTCQALSARMADHRQAMRRGSSTNVYMWMRDVGIENVVIVLIEEYPDCTSYEQQRQCEREWQDRLQPSLNTVRAYRSVAERLGYMRTYHHANRERLNKKRHERHVLNREDVLAKKREYHLANRERINQQKRERRASWNQPQRDKILAAMRECNAAYHDANRDRINQQRRKRYAARLNVISN